MLPSPTWVRPVAAQVPALPWSTKPRKALTYSGLEMKKVKRQSRDSHGPQSLLGDDNVEEKSARSNG